jgi:hypothetical protein
MIAARDNGLFRVLSKPHEVFPMVFPFLVSFLRSVSEDLSWLTPKAPHLQVKIMS